MPTVDNIHKRLIAIMSEVGPIAKNHDNVQQKYSFRSIDDLYTALQGLLVKHEVLCLPEVLDIVREERESKSGGLLITTLLKVEFTFCAPDGSEKKVFMVGEGMDSGDKASNKAMSAAQKYAFIQIFCIPTAEKKDSEFENHDPAKSTKPKASVPKHYDLGEREAVTCPSCGMLKTFVPSQYGGYWCSTKLGGCKFADKEFKPEGGDNEGKPQGSAVSRSGSSRVSVLGLSEIVNEDEIPF